MTALLPDVTDEVSLLQLHRQTAPWLPATQAVAARHGLVLRHSDSDRLTPVLNDDLFAGLLDDTPESDWERAGDGSQIVMLGADHVIKFYVPFWPQIIDREEAAMERVGCALDVEVPRVRARGELEGWAYLVVDRVAGAPLKTVRDQLSLEEELDLAESVGRVIRQLHAIEVPNESVLRSQETWGTFLSKNRMVSDEVERARGTPDEWADRLADHLRPWAYRSRPTDTFLHADLTDDHLLLRRVDGAWRLCAILDFGDVKVGDPAYEFAAPFMSWTGGRPDLRAAMLSGYGASDEQFLDRVFESILLHEFACLGALDLDGLNTLDDVRTRYSST